MPMFCLQRGCAEFASSGSCWCEVHARQFAPRRIIATTPTVFAPPRRHDLDEQPRNVGFGTEEGREYARRRHMLNRLKPVGAE